MQVGQATSIFEMIAKEMIGYSARQDYNWHSTYEFNNVIVVIFASSKLTGKLLFFDLTVH